MTRKLGFITHHSTLLILALTLAILHLQLVDPSPCLDIAPSSNSRNHPFLSSLPRILFRNSLLVHQVCRSWWHLWRNLLLGSPRDLTFCGFEWNLTLGSKRTFFESRVRLGSQGNLLCGRTKWPAPHVPKHLRLLHSQTSDNYTKSGSCRNQCR